MSIKDSYGNIRVTFDTKDGLEEKIDRLMTMMSILTGQDDGQNNSLNLRYFKVREEDRQGISMANVIMARETIREDLDQIAETEVICLVVGYNVDEIT